MTLAIFLNLLLAAIVLIAIVGMLAWAIRTSTVAERKARRVRVAAPRRHADRSFGALARES